MRELPLHPGNRDSAVATDARALAARICDLEATNQHLHRSLAGARAELQAARNRVHATREEMTRATAAFEGALEELRQSRAEIAGEQAATGTSLPLDRLLTVCTALERATTIPELLAAVVNGLSGEFSRVVLFEPRGNRFEGALRAGVDAEPDWSKVAVPVSVDSLLARAFTSGQLEAVLADRRSEYDPVLPLGGHPGCAVAVPLATDGDAIAVVYADDDDPPELAGASAHARMTFAELVRQYASLVLLRTGAERQPSGELHQFATMLADELAYVHATDTAAGLSALECQHRLKDALELSQRMYAQRLNREHRAAAAFLDERVAAAIEAQPHSPFARDLSSVLVDPYSSSASTAARS